MNLPFPESRAKWVTRLRRMRSAVHAASACETKVSGHFQRRLTGTVKRAKVRAPLLISTWGTLVGIGWTTPVHSNAQTASRWVMSWFGGGGAAAPPCAAAAAHPPEANEDTASRDG